MTALRPTPGRNQRDRPAREIGAGCVTGTTITTTEQQTTHALPTFPRSELDRDNRYSSGYGQERVCQQKPDHSPRWLPWRGLGDPDRNERQSGSTRSAGSGVRRETAMAIDIDQDITAVDLIFALRAGGLALVGQPGHTGSLARGSRRRALAIRVGWRRIPSTRGFLSCEPLLGPEVRS